MPLGDGPLQTGSVFAGHRIDGVAGRGGMGVVYRATHLVLDHAVALKVISPSLAADERFRRRFGEESRIAVSIRHPNVVPIHHAGEEDGLLFVTMDLIDGSDLRGVLAREGPLDPRRAAGIVGQVAAALDAAHARGLVHRDIKPANVLLEGRGEEEHVYLTDFGLARQIDASTGVTATGAFVGTLDYVAPEQIKGERVDARADVYALACVLYELLTGVAPFAAREDKVAKMYAHLQEEPPSARLLRPEVPGELDLVLRRALAKEATDRAPSAGDFARAVAAAAQGSPTLESERSVATGAAAPPTEETQATDGQTEPVVHAPTAEAQAAIEAAEPPVRRAPPPIPPRRELRRLALAAAGLVVVGVIVVLLLSGGGDDPEDQAGETPAAEDGERSGETRQAPPERPGKARRAGTVPVEGFPVELAHGDGRIWVTTRRGGGLAPIAVTATSESAQPAIDVSGAPEGVAVGAGSVWVASDDGTLTKLNSGDDAAAPRAIDIGGTPQGVAFESDGVWVSDAASGEVVRVDPASSGIEGRFPVGDDPYGVEVWEGDVWVTNRSPGTVTHLDPATEGTKTIDVGANPKGIAELDGRLYVTNTDDGTVSIIDPSDEEVVDTVEVGASPRGITAAFGSVWVALGEEAAVVRLDRDGDEQGRIDVADGPEGITSGPKSIWVASGTGETVTRIDPGVEP